MLQPLDDGRSPNAEGAGNLRMILAVLKKIVRLVKIFLLPLGSYVASRDGDNVPLGKHSTGTEMNRAISGVL